MADALPSLLQSRIDTFHQKFGKGAEDDPDRIWMVTNLTKPEHERVPAFINGCVISDFVTRGEHDIQDAGFVKPEDNSELLATRRDTALAESAATLETLKATASKRTPKPQKNIGVTTGDSN